jgi:cell division septal protein FtsQ
MRPTKTANNVMNQGRELQADLVDFLRKRLERYGNLVDQLRVLGYLGQALVDMANSELTQIKLQDDMAEKTRIVPALH